MVMGMKQIKAWCRREGERVAWPQRIREVLLVLFACEHEYNLEHRVDGTVLFVDGTDIRMHDTRHGYDLKCRCCNKLIAFKLFDAFIEE